MYSYPWSNSLWKRSRKQLRDSNTWDKWENIHIKIHSRDWGTFLRRDHISWWTPLLLSPCSMPPSHQKIPRRNMHTHLHPSFCNCSQRTGPQMSDSWRGFHSWVHRTVANKEAIVNQLSHQRSAQMEPPKLPIPQSFTEVLINLKRFKSYHVCFPTTMV